MKKKPKEIAIKLWKVMVNWCKLGGGSAMFNMGSRNLLNKEK